MRRRSNALLTDPERIGDSVAHRVHRVMALVAVEGPVAGNVSDELDVARLAIPSYAKAQCAVGPRQLPREHIDRRDPLSA